MTAACRAALWYSNQVEIHDTKLHGIKALRECSNVKSAGLQHCREFGWSANTVTMENCEAESEYFMMRSENLHFRDVHMKGKYSFST